MKMKTGDKYTIQGLRFGKQFKNGFTAHCRKGNETILIYNKKMNIAPIMRYLLTRKITIK